MKQENENKKSTREVAVEIMTLLSKMDVSIPLGMSGLAMALVTVAMDETGGNKQLFLRAIEHTWDVLMQHYDPNEPDHEMTLQ